VKYVEAFRSLGYSIEVPRQDWSAESLDGVCLSLWQREMDRKNGAPWLDTKRHGMPLELWGAKPGNHKRKRHLSRAVKDFSGAIDVVIVNGTPGEGYDDAHPWNIGERGASWHITNFEAETGHFSAEARRI
jgi:hypothetical protein